MLIKALAVLILMFIAPYFTLGCVLWHYNHQFLELIALIYSFYKWYLEDDNDKYFF